MLELPKLNLDAGRGSLEAWIAALARNRARRIVRRWYKHRGEALTPELASELFDEASDPLTAAEQHQRQRRVEFAVVTLSEGMSERNQRIVARYWLEEQPIPAIAVELGISQDRVWSVIRGARPRLLDLLRRAGLADEFETK